MTGRKCYSKCLPSGMDVQICTSCNYNVVVEDTQIVAYLLSQNMLHHQRLTFSICPNLYTRHMVLLLWVRFDFIIHLVYTEDNRVVAWANCEAIATSSQGSTSSQPRVKPVFLLFFFKLSRKNRSQEIKYINMDALAVTLCKYPGERGTPLFEVYRDMLLIYNNIHSLHETARWHKPQSRYAFY